MEEWDISKDTRVNEKIVAPIVRVIGSDGEQIGVLPIAEALAKAAALKLDLVEIVPNAEPPVCRIADYGKFRFEHNKKVIKTKQTQTKIKEVKLRPVTDVGDYNVKLQNIKKFLEQGHKVKITVRFRGRELAHKELGLELLQKMENDINEFGMVDQRGKFEGRQLIMTVSPKRK